MKKSLGLILAAAIGLTACSNFEKAPSGTLYKIHKSGGKDKIQVGDFVKFNVTQSSDADSVMYSSYDQEQPVVFQVPAKSYAGDMNDILTYFSEGDSATFKLNIDSLVKQSNQPKPEQLKGKYIVFNMKIEKVLHKGKDEADSTFNKRAGEFFQKDYKDAMEKIKNAEAGRIKKYVEDNKLKFTTSASGLQYIISNAGGAQKPVLGDTVMVNYTGRFLKKNSNGKDIFDTSDAKLAKEGIMPPNPMMTAYGPRAVVIGELVPGMAEGLQLLGKGGKATLLLPSKLGYGEMGYRPMVAPFQPLTFEVEVVDIKKPAATK